MTTYTAQGYDVVFNNDRSAVTSFALVDITITLPEDGTFFVIDGFRVDNPDRTEGEIEFVEGLTFTVDGEVITSENSDTFFGGLILDEGDGAASQITFELEGSNSEIILLTSVENFVGPTDGFLDPITSASEFNAALDRIDDGFNLGTGRFGFNIEDIPFVTSITEDDRFVGTSGEDLIDAGTGNDSVHGLPGADFITGGDGNDEIVGGRGEDAVFGDRGVDTLHGGSGNDLVDGGVGNDEVHGDKGNDLVIGGGNNDMLYGGQARDQLFGDNGNDTLNGGSWVDTLTGGEGRDTFVFEGDFYKDYVDDFEDNRDTLLFDSRLWAGDLTAEEIVDQFAEERANQIAFNFEDAGGEFTGRVILRGFTDLSALVNDIEIF